jgi:hypothetical protein
MLHDETNTHFQPLNENGLNAEFPSKMMNLELNKTESYMD